MDRCLALGSGEYYFSPSALIQLDNTNDVNNDNKYSSDEDFEEDSVCRVMSSDSRAHHKNCGDFDEESNDNEYSLGLRDSTRDQTINVSLVYGRFNG